MTIEPDAKSWTWVLERPCPDCGYDAGAVAEGQLADAIEDNASGWIDVLARPDAHVRPRPGVWSPLEYACHVRDVNRIFAERARSMLAEDDPQFANWDQDATAVHERYDAQEPDLIAVEVSRSATEVAAVYRSVVAGDQWSRPGRRSDGTAFTVASMGRYHLHDLVHHLWDVGFGGAAS